MVATAEPGMSSFGQILPSQLWQGLLGAHPVGCPEGGSAGSARLCACLWEFLLFLGSASSSCSGRAFPPHTAWANITQAEAGSCSTLPFPSEPFGLVSCPSPQQAPFFFSSTLQRGHLVAILCSAPCIILCLTSALGRLRNGSWKAQLPTESRQGLCSQQFPSKQSHLSPLRFASA